MKRDDGRVARFGRRDVVASVHVTGKHERRQAQRLAACPEREQPELQLLAKPLAGDGTRERAKDSKSGDESTHAPTSVSERRDQHHERASGRSGRPERTDRNKPGRLRRRGHPYTLRARRAERCSAAAHALWPGTAHGAVTLLPPDSIAGNRRPE